MDIQHSIPVNADAARQTALPGDSALYNDNVQTGGVSSTFHSDFGAQNALNPMLDGLPGARDGSPVAGGGARDGSPETPVARNPLDPAPDKPTAVWYAEQRLLAGWLLPGAPDKKRPAYGVGFKWRGLNSWQDLQDWQRHFPGLQTWLLRLGKVLGGYNLVVVDCDIRNNPRAIDIARKHLPATAWETATPNGLHLYYVAGPDFPLHSRLRIDGIDIKAGKNSYVVAPHSVINGRRYVPSITFGNGIPPQITLEMVETLERLYPKRKRKESAFVSPAPRRKARRQKQAPPPPPQPADKAPRAERRRQKKEAQPAPAAVKRKGRARLHKEIRHTGRCEYQTDCIGTRNTRQYTAVGRRILRNLRKGDKRDDFDGMRPYAYAVNRNNWGHPVRGGEDSHTLPESVVDDQLRRQVDNARRAFAWGRDGFIDWCKRSSNLAHYAREIALKPVYAAIMAGRRAGKSIKELIAISAEYRDGKGYSRSQIQRIIAKNGVYQRPRNALPDDYEYPPRPPECAPDGAGARQKLAQRRRLSDVALPITLPAGGGGGARQNGAKSPKDAPAGASPGAIVGDESGKQLGFT